MSPVTREPVIIESRSIAGSVDLALLVLGGGRLRRSSRDLRRRSPRLNGVQIDLARLTVASRHDRCSVQLRVARGRSSPKNVEVRKVDFAAVL